MKIIRPILVNISEIIVNFFCTCRRNVNIIIYGNHLHNSWSSMVIQPADFISNLCLHIYYRGSMIMHSASKLTSSSSSRVQIILA